MAGYNQGRFLVVVSEALGLTYKQVLDSSYSIIETMMQEYAYICNERNKAMEPDDLGDTADNDWITMPDFDTGETRRIRFGKMI
ncbi:hypothetical protein [Bacteroides sp. AF16-49]|uniref:hypothetical protein n=1 Tax=Bacteroides sp. AF16-49 TaxID=2292192 RepID=UPI0011C35010|nr:hypothetical protein [Bacteroides sp. AF16-49]